VTQPEVVPPPPGEAQGITAIRDDDLRNKWPALLEAATALFHANGYSRTSMQDLADAVGLLKGSLYHYIRSKDDLLFSVIQAHHRQVFQNVTNVRAMPGDAEAKLRQFVRWHAEYTLRNHVRATVFHNEYKFLSTERRREIVAARDEYEDVLRSLVAEAHDAGVLNPSVDPKLATFFILGAINWPARWYRLDGEMSADAIAARFTDWLLAGLMAR
jgi:TetR/AcrR family transcriptional regulator, cholesterol catabolism regulator